MREKQFLSKFQYLFQARKEGLDIYLTVSGFAVPTGCGGCSQD